MIDLTSFPIEFLILSLEELNKKEIWSSKNNSKFKFYDQFKPFLDTYNFSLNKLRNILSYYKNNGEFPICKICNKEHFYFHQEQLRECCCKDHQKKYAYLGFKNSKNEFFDILEFYSFEEMLKTYDLCSARSTKAFFKKLPAPMGKLKDFFSKNRLVPSTFKTLLDYYSVHGQWPKCDICGKTHANFRRRELRKFCSSKCGDKYGPKAQFIKYKEKTGYDHHMQNPEFIKKFEQLALQKTGYSYGYKNPNIQEKIAKVSYKSKSYHLNNKIYYVQGYEPQCLDYLLNVEKIDPQDILITLEEGKPKIVYLNIKSHIYIPDFYIKSQNRIIEVKSEYTFKIFKESNALKFEACKNQGYNLSIYVMNHTGCLLNLVHF